METDFHSDSPAKVADSIEPNDSSNATHREDFAAISSWYGSLQEWRPPTPCILPSILLYPHYDVLPIFAQMGI